MKQDLTYRSAVEAEPLNQPKIQLPNQAEAEIDRAVKSVLDKYGKDLSVFFDLVKSEQESSRRKAEIENDRQGLILR